MDLEGEAERSLLNGLAARSFLAMIGVVWLFAAAAAPAQPAAAAEQEERALPEKTIESVLKAHTPRLMALPGVVGAGQGLCAGAPCIKVFVAKKTPELVRQIPPAIEGYAVAVEETGEFRALDPQ